MNLFNLKSKNSKRVNLKKLILMPILIALCTIIITMLFNSSVQAYELVKPSEMTYVRWNTAKKGQVTVESYYEINKDIKGLGEKIYNTENREVSGNSLLATGMYFNYYNREGEKIHVAVKGDINGDGKVSSTDLSIFKLVYVKSRKVEYIYEKAVDMNNDESSRG